MNIESTDQQANLLMQLLTLANKAGDGNLEVSRAVLMWADMVAAAAKSAKDNV